MVELVIKTQQSSKCFGINYLVTTDLFRFFLRNKLDYPNEETTRASKKYVQAMKRITVCPFCVFNAGLLY